MRVLAGITLGFLVECGASAWAAESLPESGTARLAAYQVCHPLAAIDLGAAGARSAVECQGVVRAHEGDRLFDNLAIHCLEDTNSQPQAYAYSGSCVQTDGDGDKLYLTYEGTKAGAVKWVGGTGKYKDIAGSGTLSVLVAPAGTTSQFAYTLSYEVNFTNKSK